MWIQHQDDGREMAVRHVNENGRIVQKLVPLEDEMAGMREAREAKEPQPVAEPSPEPPQKPSVTPLDATLILARRGRKEILPKLRQILDEHPELWQHFGNLALQAQESWLGLIAGKDLYLAESLRRHLDAMRAELAGPNPTPLDRLLVDRILACHVQVLYFEAIETTDPTGENMRVARYRMERRDQAHRQFLSAVKMFATVRNLVARTHVIQVELVNPALANSAAGPVVPVAYGEQPQASGNRPNGQRNRFNTESPEPVNGEQPGKANRHRKRPKKKRGALNGSTRRMNGHGLNGNRVGHLLGTASAGNRT